MIKSKTYLKVLYGVISGGSRRQNLVAASLLYPYVSGNEDLFLRSRIMRGGAISQPYRESLSLSSMILAGGEVAGLPIVEYTAGNEDLALSSEILAGGTIDNINLFYNDGGEELSLSSSILLGGEVKTVTVRYDSSEFDPSELILSSAILTGGSVGA